MRNHYRLLLAALICTAMTQTSYAQVSGTVFKDFNFNGTQQTSGFPIEPGVYGVQVKAYNSANVQLGTTKTTTTAGAYSFTSGEIPLGTVVRMEFTAPTGTADGKVSATAGGNGSSVQFIVAPSTTTNYAISSRNWYSSTANPFVAANSATNGNPTGGGTAGTNDNLFIFPYDMSSAGGTNQLPNSQLGSVFGMAYQKPTRTVLMSAYLKRHVGFGPNGIGAIYKSVVSAAGTPATATLLVDVSTIGINVGANPRTVALPANSNTQNADVGVFAQVGKTGIGGIALTEDGTNLYLVNMFQKKLHCINVGSPLKTSFTAADVSGSFSIPDPGIAGTVWHPMACRAANGKIYVGGVTVTERTTAHALATDTVGSRGIVYEFDPTTSVFTEILRFPFNYRRGFANNDGRFPDRANWWCGWQNNGGGLASDPMQTGYNTAAGATYNGGIYYPQPMLGGIEFDVNGELIISVRDRFSDQIGYQNISDDGLPTGSGFGGGNQYFRGLTSGEVLRAGKNIGSNSYTLESLGAVTNNGVLTTTAGVAPGNPAIGATDSWSTAGAISGTPWGGFYGPGWSGTATIIPPVGASPGPNPGTQGGYFYFNHNFTTTGTGGVNGGASAITAHYCKSNGTITLLPGSEEVMTTMMDPVTASYTNGVVTLDNNTGTMTQRLQLTVTTTGTPGDPTNMGKAGGMCDLEVLTDYQPIEVGNRVWNDVNGNGIQDAGETGISGVTVQIVNPGADNIAGTADDILLGSTISSATGEYNFNTLSILADARKPAAWIGVGANDILPGLLYGIRIDTSQAVLKNYKLTLANVSANSLNNIDNDATSNTKYASLVFNAGDIDHSFDLGFIPSALGDRVWLDNGAGGGTANDGIQNGSEPGVSGIGVMLYRNGADGSPNTSDDIFVSAATTDAYGNYFFNFLTATDQTNATTIGQTSYNVRFTAAANYSFTTQTNTTDDNNTTGSSTTGSDANVFGTTYSINLEPGEINNNIDAGLIFRTATSPSSIGDRVWFDTNGDGNQDAGEPGVSGVTVTLYDAATGNILAVTKTDANGNYLFNNLPNSTYIVGFNAPGGTTLSPNVGGTTPGNGTTNSDPDPITGKTTTITISTAGTQITGIDAGIKNDPKGAIGDFVWNDLDHDGIQDAGEPGIPGVTVQLYSPGPDGVIGGGDDVLLSTATTNAGGYYLFPNLDPGKYFILVTPVSGYTLSPKDVTAGNPGGDTKDSDFGAGTGTYAGKHISPVKTLVAPGATGLTRDLTVDIGMYNATANLNSIGDFVWNDVNHNGLQDAGEPGLANITVRLYTGAGVAVNNPSTGKPYVVTTDANGNYKFSDLADGSYIVEFANLPSGYSFTQQDASGSGAPGSGTDGTTDSDVKTTTGRTAAIDLDAASAIGTSVNIITVDAGIYQGIAAGTGSMGNRVWYDINNNGLQDATEAGGVAGVKVELLDGTGAAVDGDPNTPGTQAYIIYTNALGEYLFTGLAAGDYKVKFSNFPAGFTSSTANAGTNDDIDADANFAGTSVTATTNTTTGTYTLQTGEDNLSVDMGIVPVAGTNSLGDFVWSDLNSDGIQTAGEPGVPGLTVTLYTNGADGVPATADDVYKGTTTTDSLGHYSFVGLADGNFNVGFSNLPAGMKYTGQNVGGSTAANGSDADGSTGRTGTVALDPTSVNPVGLVNNDVDAGIISSRASLGNYVWLDSNGDGVQDATEKGISGITVILYAADGTTVLASAITDANGKYYFGNLIPGTFVVGFGTGPSNLSFTKQNTPGDNGNNTNSDADPVTGKSAVITLTAGETDLTIDAGYKPDNFASVGDYVWNDLNGNGVQDATEPGVPGIVVTLYDAGNNIIGTAVTDGNGNYLISKVPAGTGYYIIFSNLPASATFTTQTSDVTPGDATAGSDANTTTGKTATFTLSAGQYLPTIDAGIKQVQLLPVSGLSFTAAPDGNRVKLEWKATGQQNVATYEVEFSADARAFSKIAENAATTGTSAVYDAYHYNPVTGLNYYRIKIIDINGRFSYSEVRKVNFGKAGTLVIYPNPTSEFVNITFPAGMINKAILVNILSADGKLVAQQKILAAAQTESLGLSKLASGQYIIRIVSGNDVINNTIQVIR